MASDNLELDVKGAETTDMYLSDVHATIENLKNNGLEHIKTNEYEFENNVHLPNYEGIYNSTIHNTGTSLDDKDIDDVAESKKATPKQIWDTMDVLSSIGDSIRAALANTFELGGEIAGVVTEPWLRAYENVSGDKTEKLSQEQKENLNVFGSTEAKESESYAGSVAGSIAQFGTGFVMTPGGGAAKGASAIVKTAKGAKTLKLFQNVLKGLAAENIAFDENMTNFTEFVSQTFDMTPPEMLAKGEDDPYFMKKLKNTMDSAAAGVVIGSAFKIAGKLYPVVKKGIISGGENLVKTKLGQKIVKPVEEAAQQALMKVDPIGSIAREESIVTEKIIDTTAKEAAESVKAHPRVLSKDEVGKIIEKAKKDGTVSDKQIKGASETVLRDVANGVVELERAAIKSSDNAFELQKLLEAGEITQQQFDKQVLNNFQETMKKAVEQKTSSSIGGTVQKVASDSETVRDINRLVKYLSENQDKIPTDKLNEFMMTVKDSKKLNAMLDSLDGLVQRGKTPDFVDKFTQVMQNIMLTSVSGRLQDAVGSLSNLSLQVLDAGTAGVIGGVKQGIRNVAAKIGLGTVKTETDRVFLNEAYNLLHGVYSLGKETLAYNSRKLMSTLRSGGFDEISPYQKARAQAVASRQSRLGKRYGDIVLLKSNSPIARLVNYAFNHGGIWASEKLDDLIGAFAYRGHLERNVAHDAMVKGIQNNWTRKEISKYTKEQLKKHIDYNFNAQDILDISEIGTEEGRVLARINRSIKQSEDTTFRSDIKSPLGKWMYDTANAPVVRKATRLIYPFQKVGIKIAIDDYLSNRSPLTLLRPGFWKEIAAGGARQDEALGKLANGLMIQGAFWSLYNEGKITGPSPSNKNKAKMLRSMGWQPFSILNEDGEYIPFKNYSGPYEAMFKSVTTLISKLDEINERADERVDAEFTDHILQLPSLFAEATLSPSFVGDLIDNIDRGDTLGIQKFVNSMSVFGIPFVSELKELFNEEEFKQTTLDPLDAFATKWGLGDTVDDLDIFGEPLWATHRKYGVGPKVSEKRADEVIEEMLYRKAYVSPPTQYITKDGKSVKLERAEVYEWQQYMSDADINTYSSIQKLINSSNYRRAPEAENNPYGLPTKRKLIVSKYNELKEKAFQKLLKNNIGVRFKFEDANEISKFPNVDEKYKPTIPTLSIVK